MEEPVIDVRMRSRYTGNLTEELRKDARRIDAFQRMISRRPILVPVKLDFSGFGAQIKAARDEIQRELMSGKTVLGPTGAPARPSITGSRTGYMTSAPAEATFSNILSTRTNNKGLTVEKRQIAPGITETARTTKRGGTVIEKEDVTNARAFKEELRKIGQLQAEAVRAAAKGDRAGQMRSVSEQISHLGGEKGLLARSTPLLGSSLYSRAEARLDALRREEARLEGRADTAAEKATQDRRRRSFERGSRRYDRTVDSRLDALDVEHTRAKTLADPAARDAEVARVMGERRKVLEQKREFYGRLDARYQNAGDTSAADKAFRRTINSDNALGQHDKDVAKAGIRTQATRFAADLKQARAERAAEFSRMISDEKDATKKLVAEARARERGLLANAKRGHDRSRIRSETAAEIQGYHMASAGRMMSFESQARREGHGTQADAARKGGQSAAREAIGMTNRFTEATRNSGHALAFHTSSMLRNAATFVQWYIPAQAAMGALSAFTTGLREAVAVDRQFATLQAVFRGSSEEAQKLKEDTLALAAANGRAADEAMSAAIGWSRLGLTRVQVSEAVRTSLMAANVAEVDAGYATEKLSAIYAGYKLNVQDLPVLLSQLNAISNRYNVTNKDLLEGITRVAATARSVGVEMMDLQGIIASGVATGRSGAEIGNAFKYVITNTSQPEKVAKLKENFDFDMTKPTGELKDYLEIMRDMAELYPKLNSYQKQMFLFQTAGARQASKFADMLENFNQGQAKTIQAALDPESAMRENEKIVASLSSQLEALQSEWTALMTALGDTGLFDLIAQELSNLSDQLRRASDLLNLGPKNREPGKIVVNDRQARRDIDLGSESTLKNMGRDIGGAFPVLGWVIFGTEGGDDSYSQEEIEKTIRAMEEAKISGKRMTSNGGVILHEGETWDQRMAPLKSLITNGDEKNLSTLRNRAEALPRLSRGLESVLEHSRTPGYDRTANVRDFEEFSRSVLALPDGNKVFSEVYNTTREHLQAGNAAGAAPGIRRMIDFVNQAQPGAKIQFSEEQERQRNKLGAELKASKTKEGEINSRIAALKPGDSTGLAALSEELAEAEKNSKNLQDALANVEKGVAGISHQAVTSFAALDQWIEGMSSQAKAMNEFRTALLGGQGQPSSRVLQTESINAAARYNGLLKARDRYASQMAGAKGIDKDQIGSTIAKLDEEIRKEKELLAIEQQKLEYSAKIRAISDAVEGGRRSVTLAAATHAVGLTETDKNLSMARFLGNDLIPGNIRSVKPDNANKGDVLGALLESESTMQDIYGRLQKRRAEIPAEMANAELQRAEKIVELERQISEEKKKQNFEAGKALAKAGKALAMADRADQLRSAALARTIRDSGAVGMNEFSMLSKESRDAFARYMPGDLPAGVNNESSPDSNQNKLRRLKSGTDEEAVKTRESLQQEAAKIDAVMGQFRDGLDRLGRKITELTGENGALAPKVEGSPPPSQQAINQAQTSVQLRMEALNVQVNLAQQFEGIVRGVIDSRIKESEARMMKNFAPPTGRPNTAGANGAAE